MAIYTMKEGTLEDREKLLESEDKEKVAEKLGLEIEELKTEEELVQHLEENMSKEKVLDSKNVAKMAAQHFRTALGDFEDRILYTELDE
jgi:thiamine pyrophosphate-dependent acetolactate synthase large subunit-like protein